MSGYDLPSPPGFLASHSGHVTEWSRRVPLGPYVPKTIGHTIFPSSDGAVGTERLDSSEGGKNQLVNFFAFKKIKIHHNQIGLRSVASRTACSPPRRSLMYNLLIMTANIRFKLHKITVHNIHSTQNLNSVTVPMCHVFSVQRLPLLGAQPDVNPNFLFPPPTPQGMGTLALRSPLRFLSAWMLTDQLALSKKI